MNFNYIHLDKLDQQLYHSIKGNIQESNRLLNELLIERPNDLKVKYNSAYMYLNQGNFRLGMENLNLGRYVNVFGSPPLPKYKLLQGKVKNKTILINLEGGFGDNFLGLKFARELHKLNNKIITLGHSSLTNLISRQSYIKKHYSNIDDITDYIDFWLPSLASELILNYTKYSQLPRDRHIFLPDSPNSAAQNIVKNKLGIKFQGGKAFEHDKYRSPEINQIITTLEKVKHKYEIYSLEKDNIDLPDWIIKSNIDDWEDCAKLISSMDCVLSTCTAVAHLSAGMNQNTIIMIPVLPYWVWAYLKDDNTSYYYSNKTKIIKQSEFGKWDDVLESVFINLINY